jgi:RNA polymerase sigma-70 factor, ECF subfamily
MSFGRGTGLSSDEVFEMRRDDVEENRVVSLEWATNWQEDAEGREAALGLDEGTVVEAVRRGDEAAFMAVAERYRRQLQVHCYRMLGSFEDSEDLVQETLLRAWRGRAGFEGRSLFRTWLYRIATNACLNALRRRPRRVLPQDVAPPVTLASDWSTPPSEPPWRTEVPWLQPFPDHLLEPAAPREGEPDAMAVTKEGIELAYLAALQHLPPSQRAVLILRDALDWSAKETAALLETSVPAVNSSLQRARATMRTRLPAGRSDWAPAAAPTDAERSVLVRFMDAWERTDATALVALLREDVRWAMPPAPLWFEGWEAIAKLFDRFPPNFYGDGRMVPTSANGQLAAASYIRPHGEAVHHLVALNVLRIEGGEIVEITTFSAQMLNGFGLPATLSK